MPSVKTWNAFAEETELFRPGRDRYTVRSPMRLHTHQYVEITCIDSGRALHFINGVERVVEPGYFVFIRAADLHRLVPLGPEPVELTNIAIPIPEFRHLKKRYPSEMEWAFRDRENSGFSTVLKPAQQLAFHQWVDELFEARRDQALLIDRFVLNVVAMLMPRPEDLPPDAPSWLVHAWREIRKPEFFPEGVNAFFKLAGRSRKHATRELKRFFGVTPGECVRQAQMSNAALQLEKSTRPILDIALECGFRDLAHFYKVFKKQYHATPRQYRISCRIP